MTSFDLNWRCASVFVECLLVTMTRKPINAGLVCLSCQSCFLTRFTSSPDLCVWQAGSGIAGSCKNTLTRIVSTCGRRCVCVCVRVRVSRWEQVPLGKDRASGPCVKEMPMVSPGQHCSQSGLVWPGRGPGGWEEGWSRQGGDYLIMYCISSLQTVDVLPSSLPAKRDGVLQPTSCTA